MVIGAPLQGSCLIPDTRVLRPYMRMPSAQLLKVWFGDTILLTQPTALWTTVLHTEATNHGAYQTLAVIVKSSSRLEHFDRALWLR